MRIDFQNMQLVSERFEAILAELNKSKERLEAEYVRLRCNTEVDSVIFDLKKTENRIENQIITVMKMIASVRKICCIYQNGEEQIKSVIECGFVQEKQGFQNHSLIINKTDFEWSIK